MSLLGVNNEQNVADPVTFEDHTFTMHSQYANEGIINGLTVTESSPQSTSVTISAGSFVIQLGGQSKTSMYYAGGTIALPDASNNTYNLVVAKVDTTLATSTIEILAGGSGASTDPDLTEGSGVFYLPLARVIGNGGNITNADITQDNSTLTNNANPEVIGRVAEFYNLLSDWNSLDETWTYSAYSSTTRTGVITVPSGALARFSLGMRVRIEQPTDGVKYGIIHDIESSTLHIFFPDGTDLDNEAINNPAISAGYSPLGFDATGDLWSFFITTGGSSQTTLANNGVYNLGGSRTLGRGSWLFDGSANWNYDKANSVSTIIRPALATTIGGSSSITLFGFKARTSTGTIYEGSSAHDYLNLSSETTLYFNYVATFSGGANASNLDTVSSRGRFVSAYI